MFYVYKLVNSVTPLMYIGISVDPKKRLYQLKRRAACGSVCRVPSYIRLIGAENFSMSLIDCFEDKASAHECYQDRLNRTVRELLLNRYRVHWYPEYSRTLACIRSHIWYEANKQRKANYYALNRDSILRKCKARYRARVGYEANKQGNRCL